jgi:ribonuclease P protein component
MIAKKYRFHGRGSLNYVYRTGKSTRSDLMSLRYAPSKRGDFRLAVVVSKKVSKSAVTRNRIRRRIYESVRIERAESGRPWPYDLVVSVFDDGLASVSAEKLDQSIKRLLSNLPSRPQ